ncbi:MAG: protein kinase [Gemmatimonadales bacterium]
MTTSFDRLTAALADHYRLERELGQGGMATVYLAHDLKHDRKVALKVLKPELAAVIGAERFVVEIKTTAALQHPHILPLFDSGTADGFLYYVMPFIDGETLRAKLDRETQLGIEEAVKIATAVADALDYAHRHGVIHRDIKPENILLHDGRPMVADFGIALALSAAAGGRMTETGMSLGTPHYMSPEQATAEKEITGRSDIYSLGSVLYEMLAGQPPHLGGSAQQIIMKIIAEPVQPVTTFRKSVPPNVAVAVAKAVEKLPADRFATAAEFAAALTDPAYASRSTMAGGALGGGARAVQVRRIVVGLGGVACLATGLALWGWFRPAPARPTIRYSMGLPPGQEMRQGASGVDLDISPDGRRIVYVGPGKDNGQLWIRDRDRLDATPLAGTDGAFNPFFSSDGSQIAFSAGASTELKVVPAGGGPPITIATPGAGTQGGGAWGADGWIYFDTRGGLSRIHAGGGTPELIVPYDTTRREIGYAWPTVLPNGRGLVYRSRSSGDQNSFDLVAFDLKSHTRHILTKGLLARYADPGYLVYVRGDGAVLAAPFNENSLALTGPAVPLFDGVMTKALGSADVAISRSGTLMYVPGQVQGAGALEIVYQDQDSSIHPLQPPVTFTPSAIFHSLSLSPDGTRVAFDMAGPSSTDLYVKQLPAGPLARLTFAGTFSGHPAWSADGRYVFYIATPGGNEPPSLWRRRADGSSPPELVLRVPGRGVSEGRLSTDGRWLVYVAQDSSRSLGTIYARRTAEDTTPIVLVAGGTAHARGAALSPDGKWLAYASDEAAREQVYVVPFPAAQSGRWQVSTDGGTAPLWSRNGRELFFEDPIGQVLSVPVRPGTTFDPGVARVILPAEIQSSSGIPYYAVTPDGRRFLRVRFTVSDLPAGAGRIVVADNWFTELTGKMKGH